MRSLCDILRSFFYVALFASAALPGWSQAIEGLKTFENRVEGIALEPHGSEDLTILGIHRKFARFSKSSDLHVGFYLPVVSSKRESSSASVKVLVEAREIIDTKHYLMQSRQAKWNVGTWNDFSPWPTKDVIDSLDLDPTNIAVLASYRDGNMSPVYLPVNVLSSNSQNGGASYTFYVQTSWDLHSVEKTIIGPSGQVTTLETDQCKISPTCILYSAASSYSFVIDMSRFSEGLYTIHIVGHVPGTTFKPELPVRIYHRPS